MLVFRIAVIGVFLAMTGPEGAFARSLDRTVIRVHCTAENLPQAQRQGLCRYLVQSLVQVIPQAAPRMVPADQWHPGRPQDISVRLEISDTSGKLVWQQGPAGALHGGPKVPFHAATTSEASGQKTFADELVAATRPVLARTLN